MLAKKVILSNLFRGEPELSVFEIVEETLGELQDGGNKGLIT